MPLAPVVLARMLRGHSRRRVKANEFSANKPVSCRPRPSCRLRTIPIGRPVRVSCGGRVPTMPCLNVRVPPPGVGWWAPLRPSALPRPYFPCSLQQPDWRQILVSRLQCGATFELPVWPGAPTAASCHHTGRSSAMSTAWMPQARTQARATCSWSASTFTLMRRLAVATCPVRCCSTWCARAVQVPAAAARAELGC